MLTLSHALFYVFSAMAITSALFVIFGKNPVQSVLSLVLTFFSMAAVWMLLEAEFLSIILVLVYVGAVMVLFLFVIMMLDIQSNIRTSKYAIHLLIGSAIAFIMIIGLGYAFWASFGLDTHPQPVAYAPEFSNIKTLGHLLYTQYLYPFEIAGVLLLVAIIAAITLTFRGKRDKKAPKPNQQVVVRKEDRIRLVDLQPESEKRTK